jgi:hypothetical protein
MPGLLGLLRRPLEELVGARHCAETRLGIQQPRAAHCSRGEFRQPLRQTWHSCSARTSEHLAGYRPDARFGRWVSRA